MQAYWLSISERCKIQGAIIVNFQSFGVGNVPEDMLFEEQSKVQELNELLFPNRFWHIRKEMEKQKLQDITW